MTHPALTDLIRNRRSVRGYLAREVPATVLADVFTLAQSAPSNCNTQPWRTHVAGGAVCNTLRQRLSAAAAQGEFGAPDFPYDGKYSGVYRDRQYDAAARLHNAMHIARDDKVGRARSFLGNFTFFGAPHAAFVFLPEPFGLREAADCGIYVQTLMLAMSAHGLASCPQTSLSLHPGIVRDVLGIGPENRLLLGISFGYEDPDAAANNCRIGRAPIGEAVVFHG